MIDIENIRLVVAKGLKDYCKCPVIRSNQNEEPPDYPFISYTITLIAGENNGSFGVYEGGIESKPLPHTWSITALSDNEMESVSLALKAREWFDRVGTLYFNENNINVQSVGSVTPRDNFLTVGYEYRKGFDVFFTVNDVIEGLTEEEGVIESTEIGSIGEV